MESRSYWKNPINFVIWIFISSFAVRLSAILLLYPEKEFYRYYLQLGDRLRENHFWMQIPFSDSPAYVYFIAFVKMITGDSLLWMLIGQALIGSLTCVLFFWLTRKFLGTGWGFLAALAASFSRSFVIHDVHFLPDSLGLFLLLSGLIAAFSLISAPNCKKALGMGALLGLCILQRPNHLLLTVLFLIYLKTEWTPLSCWFKRSLSLVMGVLVFLLPIAFLNLAGEETEGLGNPGYHFYLGNNGNNTGVGLYRPPLLGEMENPSKHGDGRLATSMASQITGQKMTVSQASSFYFQQSREYFYHYPMNASSTLLKKFWMAFNGHQPDDLEPVLLTLDKVSPLAPVSYWFIVPFGLLGFFFSLREPRKWGLLYLVMASQVVTMIVFYEASHFRLPLEAMTLIFSCLCGHHFVKMAKEKQWKCFISGGLRLIAFFLLCNSMTPAMNMAQKDRVGDTKWSLATRAQENEDIPSAIARLREVVKNEEKYSPRALEAHQRMADLYNLIRESEKSLQEAMEATPTDNEIIEFLEQEIHKDPFPWKKRQALARLYWRKRRYEEAESMMKTAVSLFPSYPEVRYDMACLQIAREKKEEGIENIEISIRDGLLFTRFGLPACFTLAEAYAQNGERNKAKAYYEQAARQAFFMRRNPTHENMPIVKKLERLGYLSAE